MRNGQIRQKAATDEQDRGEQAINHLLKDADELKILLSISFDPPKKENNDNNYNNNNNSNSSNNNHSKDNNKRRSMFC